MRPTTVITSQPTSAFGRIPSPSMAPSGGGVMGHQHNGGGAGGGGGNISPRFVAPAFSRLGSVLSTRPQQQQQHQQIPSTPTTPRVGGGGAATPSVRPMTAALPTSGRIWGGASSSSSQHAPRGSSMGRPSVSGGGGYSIPMRPQSANGAGRRPSLLSSSTAGIGATPLMPTPMGPTPSFAASTVQQQQQSALLGAGATAQLRTLFYNSTTALMLLADACEKYMDGIPIERLRTSSSAGGGDVGGAAPRLRTSAVGVLADIKCLRQSGKGDLMQGFLRVLKDLSTGTSGQSAHAVAGGTVGGSSAAVTLGGGNTPSNRPLSARGPRGDIAAAAAMLPPTFTGPSSSFPSHATSVAHQQQQQQSQHSVGIDGILGGLLQCEMHLLVTRALLDSMGRLHKELRESILLGRRDSGHSAHGDDGGRSTPPPVVSSASAAFLNNAASEEVYLRSIAAKGDRIIVDILNVLALCAVRSNGGVVVLPPPPQSSPSPLSPLSPVNGGSGVLSIDAGALDEVMVVFEARRGVLWTDPNMQQSCVGGATSDSATTNSAQHTPMASSLNGKRPGSAAGAGGGPPPHLASKVRRRLSASGVGGTSSSSSSPAPVVAPPPPPLPSLVSGKQLSCASLDEAFPFYGSREHDDIGSPFSSSPNAAFPSSVSSVTAMRAHSYMAERIAALRRNRYGAVLQWEDQRRLFADRRDSGSSGLGGGVPSFAAKEPGTPNQQGPRGVGGAGFASSTTANVFAAFQQYHSNAAARPQSGGVGGGGGSARGYRFTGRPTTASRQRPPSAGANAVPPSPQANAAPSSTAGVTHGVGILRPVPIATAIRSDEALWAGFSAAGGFAAAAAVITPTTAPQAHHHPQGAANAGVAMPWPDQLLEHAAALLRMRYDGSSGSLLKESSSGAGGSAAASAPIVMTADVYKALGDYLKTLQRRWHPDRFLNALEGANNTHASKGEGVVGLDGDDDANHRLLAKATRISQTINALRDALNRAS